MKLSLNSYVNYGIEIIILQQGTSNKSINTSGADERTSYYGPLSATVLFHKQKEQKFLPSTLIHY
jgi:hypothetical protein